MVSSFYSKKGVALNTCKNRIEFRRYTRISDVSFNGATVRKTPELAPDYRRPIDQITAEMLDVVDGEIILRNSEPFKRCHQVGCKTLGTHTVFDGPVDMEVHVTWEEAFEVSDNSGNIIQASATYFARGSVFVNVVVEDKICDKSFGDAAKEFYRKLYDPTAPTKVVHPGLDLIKYWGTLSANERKGMKLIKRK